MDEIAEYIVDVMMEFTDWLKHLPTGCGIILALCLGTVTQPG